MRREERRDIPRRRGDDLVMLPDDMIFEILLRLPVKCLLRFKCVCTGWLSLISYPHFAKSHLKRGCPTTKILAGPPFQSLDCQVLDLDERRAEDAAMFLHMPVMTPKVWVRILGSCDGLVAFEIEPYIFLWNPATGKFRRLPCLRTEITDCFILYGIGYDLASDDYKVIVGFMPLKIVSEHTLTMNVFSLKSNAWRERSHLVNFKIDWSEYRGVFLGDAVHWIASYSHLINKTDIQHVPDPSVVSMRMSDESVREVVRLPLGRQYTSNEKLQLVIIRSRLAMLVASHHIIEVWIMNEYGVQSSWTKLFTMPIVFNTVTCNLRLLGITRRGNIIVTLLFRMVLLEPNLQARMLPIWNTPGYGFSAVAYTESLVSPTGFRHF